MKQWITLGVCAITLLTSCTKDETLVASSTSTSASAANGSSISARSAASSSGSGISASSWRQSSSWSSYDSSDYRIYYSDMSAPEVTNDALANNVLVMFGRVSVTQPEYQQFNDPQMLGFYFVGTNGRPVRNAFYFYDKYTPGTARVSYSTQAMDGSMPAGVSLSQFQFRYFLVPRSFLTENNLTEDQFRGRYTYNDMMSLAGVKD